MERQSPANPKTLEKIHVAIRVRPLSSREISLRDSSAWDCVDDRTIAQRPLPPPTPPHPSSTPERSPHHHNHQKKSYSFGMFSPIFLILSMQTNLMYGWKFVEVLASFNRPMIRWVSLQEFCRVEI